MNPKQVLADFIVLTMLTAYIALAWYAWHHPVRYASNAEVNALMEREDKPMTNRDKVVYLYGN